MITVIDIIFLCCDNFLALDIFEHFYILSQFLLFLATWLLFLVSFRIVPLLDYFLIQLYYVFRTSVLLTPRFSVLRPSIGF